MGLGCLTRFEVDCERKRFARGANAHLSDDKTVAKMGHPVLVVRVRFFLGELDVSHSSYFHNERVSQFLGNPA